MLHKLLGAADGNVHQAQRGIIYIDEVDKITRSDNASMTRDVSGAPTGTTHSRQPQPVHWDGPAACARSLPEKRAACITSVGLHANTKARAHLHASFVLHAISQARACSRRC